MPKRNAIREYGVGQYYHIYNRGVNKAAIFYNSEDYEYLLILFQRHLSKLPSYDSERRKRPHYYDDVELTAYCLLPNHYHLLVYMKNEHGVEKLMRSVMTAYTSYVNQKYGRVGTLFQGNFLASRISSDRYLWHVSRYIHLNALDVGEDPKSYKYSSIGAYLGEEQPEWVHPERLVATVAERKQYEEFMYDYIERKYIVDEIKHELANK